MKKILPGIALLSIIVSPIYSQTVTGIAATYHDGQIFITWNNIPAADTGFYYVYKNKVPITAANIQSSSYLGRVPFNFSYDYRLSHSLDGIPPRYLITNDNPLTVLTASQNLFVMNCLKNNQQAYFAVRCDYGYTSPNWTVVTGANTTTAAVVQHLDPIRAYLQETVDPVNENNESMDVYLHYGTNVSVGSYPAMANEGCLPYHFGIIKTGSIGGNNKCFIKFHAGGGNFITDAIVEPMQNTWKVSFDDWTPAFNSDPAGSNTRWLGYSDHLDIYGYTHASPPPTTGTIKAYTLLRNQWEINWIKSTFPGTIDPARIYLIGNSQGNGGVLLNCIIYPEQIAAGSLSDAKFNMDAPDDDDPDCKYNEGHSGRTNTRLLWGNEDSVNLSTNIPKTPGGNIYYKIYDLTNMNDMYNIQKDKSLPFIFSISGKTDENTCWEEKPPFFQSVQKTQAGGIYYWDLRGHSGNSNNAWPNVETERLLRFGTNKSYPAFSNCALDGDPGLAINPNPPYYSGDDTGSLHGNIDWVDATVADNVDSWQAQLFIFQDTLNGGTLVPTVLPASANSDVSIRRAQNFKGFTAGTHFCWYNIHNGDTIQSGSVTHKYDGASPKPITVKKVKVFPDGNILRLTLCSLKQSEGISPEAEANHCVVYPNPFGDQFTLDVYTPGKSEVTIEVFNLVGGQLLTEKIMTADEGNHNFQVDASAFDAGVYLVKVKTADHQYTFKLVKE